MEVMRRVTYKMYPSPEQARELERINEAQRQLYNAALEERISAYSKGISITYLNQAESLTEIRSFDETHKSIHSQIGQVTLKRLDEAYRHFFRRCKTGETPGFPRFKSKDRWPGFGYKQFGFKYTPGPNWKHGVLNLSGIGDIRVRGEARTPGRAICCSIMRKADGWFLSLVLSCEPHREHGEATCGFDWGVESVLTMAYGEGVYAEAANDRFLRQEAEGLADKQRALSKTRKRTKRHLKQKRRLAVQSRKLANKRKNRAHQLTSKLVSECSLICAEDLNIGNMTASAKGTPSAPGKNVAQKAGLNKAILDTTPGLIYSLLSYKAEEAGCLVHILDTKRHKPSQTCPRCGRVKKKSLGERRHSCECGFVATRDQASALHCLLVGIKETGWEPAADICQETPSRVAA